MAFVKELKFGMFNNLDCVLQVCSFLGDVLQTSDIWNKANLRSNSTVHTICSLGTCRSLFGRVCKCAEQFFTAPT